MEHDFTPTIKKILRNRFSDSANAILAASELLQYLNIKTKSASRGSKSRGSFGNHYALYVLIEDYISGGFDKQSGYENYEGAVFSSLMVRQRELPFGSKLQNHALNHRMNQEFKKYFPTCEFIPILRNAETSRYWINENLMNVSVAGKKQNIAPAVIEIIDAYVDAKRDAFDQFIASCEQIQQLQSQEPEAAKNFILKLVQPNVDARVFEIVSFAILKAYYSDHVMYWGWSADSLKKTALVLYKTGRTNANDGGIDFVMRPLGRFFQVTETTDVKKYFLDIDKVQRFPVTFVVKATDSQQDLKAKIKEQATRSYGVASIVQKYMDCVEEIVNIPTLIERFDHVAATGKLDDVIDEIVLQSKVEFNYQEPI